MYVLSGRLHWVHTFGNWINVRAVVRALVFGAHIWNIALYILTFGSCSY